MASKDQFLPSVKKREAPYRGQLSSRDYNSFQDEVIADFSRLQRVVNNISSRFENRILQLEGEIRALASINQDWQDYKDHEDTRKALAGEDLLWSQGLHDFRTIQYEGITKERQLNVSRIHGQAVVPFNRVVSRLYSYNPVTDELFVPTNLTVSVDAIDEADGTVITGNPSLSTDGRLGEGFIRKVAFPTETDKRYVTMDVTIDVPSLYASSANLLTLFPNPAGECDILNIWYSTSDADPSTVLQVYSDDATVKNFEAKYDVQSLELVFAPTTITKLKIQIRQKNSVIEDDQRVFTYGFREVHLDLVEWDQTALDLAADGFKKSNSIYFRLDAPTGYTFDTLKDLRSTPPFAATSGQIQFDIYGNSDMQTNPIWDSTLTALSASPVDISASNYTSIYVGVRIAYDSSLVLSPVLWRFWLRYSVQ